MRMLLLLFVFATGCLSSGAARPEGPPPAEPLADVESEELYRKGVAYARRGDSVRAEQYLNAALAKGKSDRVVVPALVRVCVASSRFQSGLGYAESYLRRYPADWPMRFLVSSLHLGLGDTQAARRELEHVVAQRPDMAAAYFWLGVIAQDQMRMADARAHFSQYLTLAPTGPQAAQARARLHQGEFRAVSSETRESPRGAAQEQK